MTFKYNNVYINNFSTVAGKYEANGPFKNFFDLKYKDFYIGEKTFEKAETKMLKDSVDILLKKLKLDKSQVDIQISGDLSNQLTATNYSASLIGIPLIGIYGACSTSTLGMCIAANMIESKQVKNAICSVSSHNNAAEKQFRQPVEYGGPKRKTATFTVTGASSCYLSNKSSNVKIDSATIGTVVDMGIKDVYHMGAVMAPAAIKTINEHLKNTNRKVDYYDLILTGDLGMYGKDILKDCMKNEFNIDLKNYDDSACMIYDIKKQPVYAGGSGPACLPLVTFTYVFDQIKKGKLKNILLVATGALMSQSLVNEKSSIPAVAHAISLEVIK